MTFHPHPRSGFSLLELMCTVALLVLLVGVIIPSAVERRDAADRARVHAHLDLVARAVSAHFVDTGRWPFPVGDASAREPTGLAELFRNAHGLAGWAGPYLADEMQPRAGRPGLSDPWGHAYGLQCLAPRNDEGALVLWSRGPNGILDTPLRELRAGRALGDDVVRRVARLY